MVHTDNSQLREEFIFIQYSSDIQNKLINQPLEKNTTKHLENPKLLDPIPLPPPHHPDFDQDHDDYPR